MMLSSAAWSELIDLGVLQGEETCALCFERPAILVDVAKAPILLCPAHARATLEQIQSDLQVWAAHPAEA